MYKNSRLFLLIAAGASALIAAVTVRATRDRSQDKTAEQARIAFSHALPPLDGSQLKVTLVEITYGPRESSPPHSHPCTVIAYVVKGVVRTQVEGEAEVIHKAGESFYEARNGVHLISANASDKTSAKLLAYFVCDRDTSLSVAPPTTHGNQSSGQPQRAVPVPTNR